MSGSYFYEWLCGPFVKRAHSEVTNLTGICPREVQGGCRESLQSYHAFHSPPDDFLMAVLPSLADIEN